MLNKARNILLLASDQAIADSLLDTFIEVEKNYFKRAWKTSELDSGHFVEAVRRFLDLKLLGTYQPIGTQLANFNDRDLQRLANTAGHEQYRLHIPRALFIIYGLRNKRGVGHLNALVNPNHLDATFILGTCKWVLAEIIRTESSMSFDETAALVERIVERPIPGLWDIGATRRILVDGLKLNKQILFLLLSQSPQTFEQLTKSIEYHDKRYFERTIRRLHRDRLIEFDGTTCHLSPKGTVQGEKIAQLAAQKKG